MRHRATVALSRRLFLRGAGVALPLPWLASVAARRAAGVETAAAAPRRIAFLFFPNGASMRHWVPDATGADYAPPLSLEPLEAVRRHVLVLSGLDKRHSRQGDGHYAKTANFLTGMPVTKTTGADLGAGGISVDQLIARELRGRTAADGRELLSALEVCCSFEAIEYLRVVAAHSAEEAEAILTRSLLALLAR